MYFFGKYNHQMDAKGRLRIPCKLKSALGSDFIVSRGVGGCLFIFAPDKIEEIQRKLASIPFGDNRIRRPQEPSSHPSISRKRTIREDSFSIRPYENSPTSKRRRVRGRG